MATINTLCESEGYGEIIIQYDDGLIETRNFRNRIVDTGRTALAKSLANQFGGIYEYWVNGMLFGSGGTVGGTPRYIEASRNGLFGPTVATKAVIATINPSLTTQVVFTSVLLFDDAVGQTVNEMGLRMRSGDFFSLTSFGDIAKTSSQQITVNWRLNFV